MAAFYKDCAHENTLKNLDFAINKYLKPKASKKWLKDFTLTIPDLEELEKDKKEIMEYEGVIPPGFHWVVHWFVYGLDGPFGQVTGEASDHLIYNLVPPELKPRLYRKSNFENLIPHPSSLVLQQTNAVNCSVCCSLFVFDMVITQSLQTWKTQMKKGGGISEGLNLGSSVLRQELYIWLPKLPPGFNLAQHMIKVYNLFGIELVVLMERLRYMQLETIYQLENLNLNDESWGHFPEEWIPLHGELAGHIYDVSKIFKVDKPFLDNANNLEDNLVQHGLFSDSYVVMNKLKQANLWNMEIINTKCHAAFPSESKLVEMIYKVYGPAFEEHAKK